jgi:hypothetical protein
MEELSNLTIAFGCSVVLRAKIPPGFCRNEGTQHKQVAKGWVKGKRTRDWVGQRSSLRVFSKNNGKASEKVESEKIRE